jgi:hypothetical protein
VTTVAGERAIDLATKLAFDRAFIAEGSLIRDADPGAFLPTFEAVPLGHSQAATGFLPGDCLNAATGRLMTSFAAGASIGAAGRPISVAGFGWFDPIFKAVPLGTLECGFELRIALYSHSQDSISKAYFRRDQDFNWW